MVAKRFLLFILAFIAGLLIMRAQPVLTSPGVNPVIGDVYVLNSGNYVSPGNSGANQTWDLTGIAATISNTYVLGTVVSAPDYTAFSNGSNIQMDDGDYFSFFYVDSAKIQNSGLIIVSQGIYIPYSNNEDVLHFPFNMNDTFTDAWSATFTLSAISFTRNGTSSVVYDGYGSLTVPGQSFSNVARLHATKTYTDVSLFSNTAYTDDEYIWMTPGFHQAIARVSSLTASSPAATTQGGYYTVPPPVVTAIKTQTNDPAPMLTCFPNPALGSINFAFRDGLVIRSIQVFDPYARLVYTEAMNASAGLLTIDLDAFASGIYTVKITLGSGAVKTQKISVIK